MAAATGTACTACTSISGRHVNVLHCACTYPKSPSLQGNLALPDFVSFRLTWTATSTAAFGAYRATLASSPPRAPPLRSARYSVPVCRVISPESPYAVRYGPRKMVETQVCSGALLERPRGYFGYGTPHAVGTPHTQSISWPEFLLNASRAQPQPHAESQHDPEARVSVGWSHRRWALRARGPPSRTVPSSVPSASGDVARPPARTWRSVSICRFGFWYWLSAKRIGR
jgi:hypothetical protein